MASILEKILGEKEGALPPEPVKPEKTGDFWRDLKAGYDFTAAQAEYLDAKARATQNPFSEQMKTAEFRPINKREQKFVNLARLLDVIEGDRVTSSTAKAQKFFIQ